MWVEAHGPLRHQYLCICPCPWPLRQKAFSWKKESRAKKTSMWAEAHGPLRHQYLCICPCSWPQRQKTFFWKEESRTKKTRIPAEHKKMGRPEGLPIGKNIEKRAEANLPLGELEPRSCALLTGLLALLHAGVPSEEARLLEHSPERRVGLDEGP